MVANEITRDDVIARRVFFLRVIQPFMDHAAFYFIDETSATLTMTRSHGLAPVGERLVDSAPWHGRSTSTLLAAMGQNGVVAPLTVSGAVDRPMFVKWVETRFGPVAGPGATAIMDNASIHKGEIVREAFRNAGVTLIYLPAYSPDLNPIELFFSLLKQALRAACARTRQALDAEIARAIAGVGSDLCRKYFVHCGYDSL